MKGFFTQLGNALQQGRPFVLVSIISCTGSTPGGQGARMAVFEDGTTLGTIGGGAVEYAAAGEAMEGFAHQGSWSRGFTLTPADRAGLGMVCGGTAEVSFMYIDARQPRFAEMFFEIAASFDENTDLWLVTGHRGPAVKDMGIYDTERGFRFFENEPALPDGQKARLFGPAAVLLKDGDISWFAQPLTGRGYVCIFGGGHVAQALVPVLAPLSFKCLVFEDREEFCKKERFLGVSRVVHGDFRKLAPQVDITDRDFVVIMTRGHQSDYEVLTQALASPAPYIGVIGSRKKIAASKERLLKDGFSLKQLERIHWPIGLAIRAKTPAEIAVSIAAELILCRAQLREDALAAVNK